MFSCSILFTVLNSAHRNETSVLFLSALTDNYAFPIRYAAKDKRTLQAHHITHVLNAADGKFNVNTGASFYRDTRITYHGVEAFDMPSFNLSPFFYPAAYFIKNALSSPTGEELSLTDKTFIGRILRIKTKDAKQKPQGYTITPSSMPIKNEWKQMNQYRCILSSNNQTKRRKYTLYYILNFCVLTH